MSELAEGTLRRMAVRRARDCSMANMESRSLLQLSGLLEELYMLHCSNARGIPLTGEQSKHLAGRLRQYVRSDT